MSRILKPLPGTPFNYAHPLFPGNQLDGIVGAGGAILPLNEGSGTPRLYLPRLQTSVASTATDRVCTLVGAKWNPYPGANAGTSKWGGPTLSNLTAGTDKINLGINSDFLPYDQATIVIGYKKRTTGDGYVITTQTSTASQVLLFNLAGSTGAATFYWAGTDAAHFLQVTGLTFGDDVWVLSVGARGFEIWQNGSLVGSNSNTGTRSNNTNILGLGQHAFWGNADIGDYAFFYVYPTQLTRDQITYISNDPFCFYDWGEDILQGAPATVEQAPWTWPYVPPAPVPPPISRFNHVLSAAIHPVASQLDEPARPAFSPAWAWYWVPPVWGPKSMAPYHHALATVHPIASQFAAVEPLGWFGVDAIRGIETPAWPSTHLISFSIGPPLLVESPGWFGLWNPPLPVRPKYPEPPALAFSWPTEFATFPHVPPTVFDRAAWTKDFDYDLALNLVAQAPIAINFVPTVAPTQSCGLTLGMLKQRVYEQLDDDGTYYTGNEVRHALNAAQNLFALITLCIERTANFTPLGETCFYLISEQLSDFLVPLRVTCGGSRIRPTTFHQLDGDSSTWRNTATGTPTRYVVQGYDLIAFTPQFIDDVIMIRITYAASPVQLVLDTDTPEIPSEQHMHLVDYACWWLRLKEGGTELANASQYLQRFLEAAKKYAEFVRRRSYAQRYDTYPFDLASFDMGRKKK